MSTGHLFHDLLRNLYLEIVKRPAFGPPAGYPDQVMKEAGEVVFQSTNRSHQVWIGRSILLGPVDTSGEEESQVTQLAGVAFLGILVSIHGDGRPTRIGVVLGPSELEEMDDPKGGAVADPQVAIVVEEEIGHGGEAGFEQVVAEPHLEFVSVVGRHDV